MIGPPLSVERRWIREQARHHVNQVNHVTEYGVGDVSLVLQYATLAVWRVPVAS